MNRTPIDWVKNPDGTQGYTWNPITGCLNGCSYCYARKLANGRLKPLYLANRNHAPTLVNGDGCWQVAPFYPRFWEDRVAELQRGIDDADYASYIRQKGKGIFVCDMSDLFGIGVPENWTANILETIADDCNSMHRFYLLTKQPQNLIKFSPFPDNCWVGVTATNTEMLMQACSHLEYPLEAKVKYLSIEPFLDWDFSWNQSYLVNILKRADTGLVIIGAQTNPYKPPKIEWVEEIVRACDKAGIPVFLKDNLKELCWDKEHNIPIFVGDAPYSLRQEMPKIPN